MLVIPAQADTGTVTIPTAGLPVVSFGTVLTFVVRMFFIVAGIAALIYALIGGLDWETSGGEKEKIDSARDKITAAIVGIFVLILVLTIVWTLEQVVFHGTLCFGVSCDVRVPSLVGDDGSGTGGGGGSGGGGSGADVQKYFTCDDFCKSSEGLSGGMCAFDLIPNGDGSNCPSKTSDGRDLHERGYRNKNGDLYDICHNSSDVIGKCCCIQ